MPTSTLWRRELTTEGFRGRSPTRPIDAVERISPEPQLSPSSMLNDARSGPNNHGSLFGLGLSQHDRLSARNDKRRREYLHTYHNAPGNGGNGYAEPLLWSSSDQPAPDGGRDRDVHSSAANGHTRSGSTIDDLADAAIATSPTFSNNSPHIDAVMLPGSPSQGTTQPATSHITRYSFHDNIIEHPAKRVKSEIIHQYEFSHHDYPRPNTSYTQARNTIPEEDVALLLGLKQEVNFKFARSPPTPRLCLRHSPSHRIRSYSPVPASPIQHNSENLRSNTIRDSQHVNGVNSSELDRKPDSSPGRVTETHTPTGATFPVPSTKNLQDSARSVKKLAESATIRMSSGHEEEPIVEVKKIRRIKPQVQAEVCAECNKLQREVDEEDVTISWICCNGCNRWFHAACAGFKNKAEARSVDKFVCTACEPEHGSTTFVRKSSRARHAIDYAELNQGLVKSSIETSMHHYIDPIKTGKFVIQPDDFMRVRPEVLTADFVQSMDGMKRPFVVPAAWNPRFGVHRDSLLQHNETSYERYDSSGAQLEPDLDDSVQETTEEVIDLEQDLLDMVMPRDLTVRKVAELYGKHEVVPVIDVKSQETKGTWTLEQWADYYEDPGDKPIRNVISLEVSESPLGRLIRRPRVVRELDLEDQVWDAEARANQKKRYVQFYCLMSVADSYTDFHIDFGGSSVYYHILKGVKTFFFIPPEDKYLKKYEEWCNSHAQNETWLPDLCNGNVTRVDLHEGDTAFIPAGWIHSVWTPVDSLVIGGNYLTSIDYELQLKVAQVEKATHVAAKFRYPFFQKVMWYALIRYLEDDPVPDEVMDEFQNDPDNVFLRANPVWLDVDELENNAGPGTALFNARHYPKSEIKGLAALRDYLYRTARIYADLPVDNINKKQIDAVKASVPRGHGDPLTLIKTFAIWCAWKIGGVTVPSWVYSDAGGFPETEKTIKKQESARIPVERSSSRRVTTQSVAKDTTGPAVITPYKPGFTAAGVNPDPLKKGKPQNNKPTLARVACDSCRKRRVKCKHKDVDGLLIEGEQSDSRSQTPEECAPPVQEIAVPAATPTKGQIVPDLGSVTYEATYPNCGLAQAALANLDEQCNGSLGDMGSGQPGSGKKSRSKACEECRKSKRRCVHDEYGRVDPAKAAEPSKPRGSSNSKRPNRLSDAGQEIKLTKSADPHAGVSDSVIDPVLFNMDVIDAQAVGQDITKRVQAETRTIAQAQAPELGPPPTVLANADPNITVVSEQSIPVSRNLDDNMNFKTEEGGDVVMSGIEPVRNGAASGDDSHEHAIVDSPELNKYANSVPSPSSQNGSAILHRHSSRPMKPAERYVPLEFHSPSKTLGKAPHSSQTTGSGRPSAASVKNRRSSSNTSSSIAVHAIGMNGNVKSDESRARSSSAADSALDEDERLARELQAEEHGLRRRRSSVKQ